MNVARLKEGEVFLGESNSIFLFEKDHGASGILFGGSGSIKGFRELRRTNTDVAAFCDLVLIDTKSLSELLEEPEEQQPALTRDMLHFFYNFAGGNLLTHSETGIKPRLLAGEDVGFYNAMYEAGVVPLEIDIELLRIRNEAISQGMQKNPGALIQVDILSSKNPRGARKKRDTLIGYLQDRSCDLSAIYSDTSFVVGGLRDLVHRLYIERGGFLNPDEVSCMMLYAPGAIRTQHMFGAENYFRGKISDVPFADPHTPIVASTSGEVLRTGEEVREELIRQFTHPLRLDLVTQTLDKSGILHPWEIGHKAIITRMRENKKIVAVGAAAAIAAGAVVVFAWLPQKMRSKK